MLCLTPSNNLQSMRLGKLSKNAPFPLKFPVKLTDRVRRLSYKAQVFRIPEDRIPMISQKFRSKMGTPKVLIVDDEVQLAEIYRAVLQSAGAKVEVAYDAADAVDLIKAFKPDIIVSDIRMPEVRGDELLVALSSYDPDLPVILVTGLERSKISVPKDSENLFHLLHKPVDYDSLIRAVQSALTLVETKKLNELLLKQKHAESKSNLSYEEWRSKEETVLLQRALRHAS